jgi:hypothetical protein
VRLDVRHDPVAMILEELQHAPQVRPTIRLFGHLTAMLVMRLGYARRKIEND